MEGRLHRFISQHHLCTQSDTVLVAVSGGLDSMALLHLMVRAGYQVAVAHVNFGLRGPSSLADEKLVQETCDALGVHCHKCHADTRNYAKSHQVSIQMAAREIRYDFFDQLAEAHGYTSIATAHHLDDAAEHILMAFSRGRGSESLLGTPIRNGRIIRPLLFTCRQELERWVHENHIPYREDETNETDDYERNAIRHHIMPVWRNLYPALTEGIDRARFKGGGEWELMQEGLHAFREQFTKTDDNGNVLITKRMFSHYNHPASVLWKFLQPYGFNTSQIQDVEQAIDGTPGRQFRTSTHQLVIDRDSLVLRLLPEEFLPVLIEAPGLIHHHGEMLQVETGDFAIETNADVGVFDAMALRFPLTWRVWKPGDKFVPLGMSHHKKISDLLVDLKINRGEKDNVTVLESGGQIAWVVGIRVDDRFKVTSNTRTMLRLRRLSGASPS